jgi:hypothetical protein
MTWNDHCLTQIHFGSVSGDVYIWDDAESGRWDSYEDDWDIWDGGDGDGADGDQSPVHFDLVLEVFQQSQLSHGH